MINKPSNRKNRATLSRQSAWQAGLGIADITPPLGTHMFGWAERDRGEGCQGIHDPLQVRAVYISDGGQAVLILSCDVLFFDRAEADRIKGAVGRAVDLCPRQILLNCSHTHAGPVTGTWGYAGYQPLKNPAYMDDMAAAMVQVSREARMKARPAECRYGLTQSNLPISRRRINAQGKAEWRPAPNVPVYKTIPIISFHAKTTGKPVAIIFTVACHPSTIGGLEISADYPGPARELIDKKIGRPVAVFLQGCGGDTKASIVANGPNDASGLPTWRGASWSEVNQAGALIAQAVLDRLPDLKPLARPRVRAILAEIALPLTGIPTAAELDAILQNKASDLRSLWAERQLKWLRQKGFLPKSAPILVQGIRLADTLQLVALEGEPVAAWGWAIEKAFRTPTIPLGYSNGQGLYLPVESMLKEGGYEVESVYEYGFAGSQLAKGFTRPVFKAFQAFKKASVLA